MKLAPAAWIVTTCVLSPALTAPPARAADPQDGLWRGQAGASLNTTTGNTSTQNLLLNLDLSRQTVDTKLSLVGAVTEGQSRVEGTSTTTAGKWALDGQYDHNITADWFGFAKLGVEHDRVTDLSLRTLVGTGLGHHWVKTPQHTFDVYGGASRTLARYGQQQLIDGRLQSSFATTSVIVGENSAHQLTETVSFNQRLEAYPAVSGTKNTQAKLNAGLTVSVTRTLSLNLGLIQTYNSEPAQGTRMLDSTFFTGINVKLGP
ncbi:DUF481 domain-containing protein [Ideonella livida]|uniref:DUF481 domain-containing protein n=1 Tax=Ideonella livida TaxID=2707176 RepID=A0A7C9THT1_9BURK|nr:DUF481 domain-containing protein [Ideonella livida]NDY89862.1 DUF481 domain-containing protein [Ideonella livida]